MSQRTERETLVARFQAMKASDGLRDMKFFFGQVSESTVDEFCAEVNRLYRLVEQNKFTDVPDWGDGTPIKA